MTFSVYSVSNDICHYCKLKEKSIGISYCMVFLTVTWFLHFDHIKLD